MGKLEEFEHWKEDGASQALFMQRVSEGNDTPKEICEAMGLPYSATMRHIKGTPPLFAEYRSALETWVEALAHETVTIADGVQGTDEAAQVAAAKLRCDTRFRLASKLYREMFGEDVKPALNVNISLGDVSREIRELEARLGISGAALPQPVVIDALPAPVVEKVTSEPPI